MAKIDTDKFIALLVEKYRRMKLLQPNEKCWIEGALSEMGFEVENGEIVEIKKEEPNPYNILDVDVINFNLPIRSQNILKENNIKTMRDLVRLTKVDYLKFRNSGKVTLMQIESVLKSFNLNFGMDV